MAIPRYARLGPSGTPATGTAAIIAPPPTPVNNTALLIEAKGEVTPDPDPVIKDPVGQAQSWDFAKVLKQMTKSAASALFDRYIYATLCRASYGGVSLPLYEYLGAALGSNAPTRIQVSQQNNLWVDEYVFPSGKKIIVFVGTTESFQFFQYLQPGMSPVENPANTPTSKDPALIYTGFSTIAERYASWFCSHYNPSDVKDDGHFILVGHSMGGVGALLSAYYFNSNYSPNPPPEGLQGPVANVTTFGMPSAFAFNDDNGGLIGGVVSGYSMLANFAHVRCYDPGDPVVWLPTQVMSLLKAFTSGGKPGYPIPTHFDSIEATVQPYITGAWKKSVNNWYSQNQLGAYYNNPAQASSSLGALGNTWATATIPHMIISYADNLELACRNVGFTPYPLFTQIVTANRWMKDMGY